MSSKKTKKAPIKGLLYFAKNPAFPHLVKIGRTFKLDVVERGLSASNVPENFNYLKIFECEDIISVENKVHKQFANYRHRKQCNATKDKAAKDIETEFFWEGCIKEAIKYTKDLKGVIDTTEDETEEIETINEVGEKQIRRAPQSTFEMLGLEVGTKIFFKNYPNFVAIIADNKNKITYKGKTKSISTMALDILKAQGNKLKTANGYEHFYVNDKRLLDLRPDKQKETDETQDK